MASSVPQANNVTVKFRGQSEKERPRMPSVSKAQNGAMQAAKDGKSTLGIPKEVGEGFADAQTPGSVKKLPATKNPRVDKLRARGLISDKQAQKLEKA